MKPKCCCQQFPLPPAGTFCFYSLITGSLGYSLSNHILRIFLTIFWMIPSSMADSSVVCLVFRLASVKVTFKVP